MIEDNILKKISIEKIIKEALSEGGEFSDIFFEKTYKVTIVCEDNRIEKIIPNIDFGVGIRTIFDGRTYYSFTNKLSEKDLIYLAQIIKSSIKNERRGNTFNQPYKVIPIKISNGIPSSLSDKDPNRISIDEKVSVVKRANDFARKLDSRIRQIKVMYQDLARFVSIANSDGIFVEGDRCETVFSVQVVSSEDGVIQTGYEAVGGTIGFELFDTNPPEEVARIAANRALMMLRARESPMGRMTVILSSHAGGTMIHEAIGHGLEADLAQQGLSVYSNKLGEKVASSLITVVDDPSIPKKRGSYVFDDEGVFSRRTVLVEEGILKGYLYDRLTAMKASANSTGNGRRESYRHRPIPRMSNTMIIPGKMKPEQIIHSVEKGLYVKKMGGGQVNTVNGDFVFEISECYLIEKGTISEPVRGATLIGNGPKVLKEIDMVGDDLGFGIGTCGKDGQGVPIADGQPTLRIPEIIVGGREQ